MYSDLIITENFTVKICALVISWHLQDKHTQGIPIGFSVWQQDLFVEKETFTIYN